MVIDGKKIAEGIYDSLKGEVKKCVAGAKLFILSGTDDPATKQFLTLKKKRAESLGITVLEKTLPNTAHTQDFLTALEPAIHDPDITAIVVQLPLPKHVNTDAVLNKVPTEKDIDVLSEESWKFFTGGISDVIPPVAGALEEILWKSGINIKGKNAVVIGAGRLVGKPVAVWLKNKGASVSIVSEPRADLVEFTGNADIIVSGAGVPSLIKPHMIKEGVILLDAGTSEAEGRVVGDADPACAEKAQIFTPVPGGIGPITVAKLFENFIKKCSG